jgi:hypothetical protein
MTAERVYEVLSHNYWTGSERWSRTNNPPPELVALADASPDGGQRTVINGVTYTWYTQRRMS